MKLVFDPRDPGRTRLVLIRDGVLSATHDVVEKDKFFGELKVFLEKHGGTNKLSEVGVVAGGGSFSGVRTAVVISRTLGLVLGVPVLSYKWKDEEPTENEIVTSGKPLVITEYSDEPNITQKK